MKRENKGRVNKWRSITALLAVFILTMSVFVSRAEGEKILSTVVYEDEIYIYVKGVSVSQEEPVVQIGNTVCSDEQISWDSFQGQETPMRMLILVDNSKSIPDKNHENIQNIVNGVIAGSREDMQFCLGTFSDQVTYLCDYTSDRDVLAEAAGSIVYQDQNTYFSDMLYTVIEQLKEEDTPACTGILILSDGADNQSIGYTNDEVRSYVGENVYPVYTVGILGKNNTSELETMFSFSRASGSEYFLLDGTISYEEIVSTLLQDQEGVCIKITPDEGLKDGSKKSILLKLVSEEGVIELKTNVDMPFGDGSSGETEEEDASIEPEEEPENTLPTLQASNDRTETPDPSETLEKEEKFPWFFVLLGSVCALTLLAVIVRILMKKGRSDKDETKEQNPSDERTELLTERDGSSDATEETELEGASAGVDDAKSLWQRASKQYYLIIKSLDDSRVMFKVPITDTICIGRGHLADIVLDDPKVSRKHCEIILKGDLLYIKDCDSKNKTYYEDVAVYGEMPIVSGGRIKVGSHQYSIELEKA